MKLIDMVNAVASSGILKKDHYHWSDIEDKCRHEKIALSKINIPEYQRGEASRSSTITKARKYNNAASGACIVAKRKDGTYWIVDGLQRTLARAIRGDSDLIDCMVFDSEGEQHESKVFRLCNIGRTNVSAIHKYKVAVIAADSLETEIDRWINENGFVVDDNQSKNQIGFISVFVQNWKHNSDSAKRAVTFCRNIGKIEGSIFKGAAHLIRNGIDIEDYVEKIIAMGGHTVLLRDINATAIEANASKNPSICAAGILKSINYKKRDKIKI